MRKTATGFSLLELVIVVFLVALFSTAAILRLGVGQGIVIKSEARQFAQRLNLLMDESLLSGQVFRIVFDIKEQAYEYQRFQQGWGVLTEEPFGRKILPSGVAFEMEINQINEVSNLSVDTQLFDDSEETAFERNFGQKTGIEIVNSSEIEINSDGTATPFEIRFGERTKKSLINHDSIIWLIKGGQSVSIEQESEE